MASLVRVTSFGVALLRVEIGRGQEAEQQVIARRHLRHDGLRTSVSLCVELGRKRLGCRGCDFIQVSWPRTQNVRQNPKSTCPRQAVRPRGIETGRTGPTGEKKSRGSRFCVVPLKSCEVPFQQSRIQVSERASEECRIGRAVELHRLSGVLVAFRRISAWSKSRVANDGSGGTMRRRHGCSGDEWSLGRIGKTVQTRRGPAAVSGDERRTTPLRMMLGKARPVDRSGSQKTCPVVANGGL